MISSMMNADAISMYPESLCSHNLCQEIMIPTGRLNRYEKKVYDLEQQAASIISTAVARASWLERQSDDYEYSKKTIDELLTSLNKEIYEIKDKYPEYFI